MDQQRITILVDRYLNQTITADERAELMQWYREFPEEIRWYEHAESENELKDRLQQTIWSQTINKPTVVIRRNWMPYAAAVLISCLFVSFYWLYQPANELIASIPAQQNENRFVLLPDSSKVILRPGSILTYVNDFSEDTREVALVGEAYFDIKKDPSKPFIIHSGDIKTRVLGTAFTIDATNLKQGVQVFVERGKVQVESKNKVLAELVANQQLTYNAHSQVAVKETTQDEVAITQIGWTGKDMRFDSKAFGELTEILSRRYAVNISFANQDMSNCLVSGTFTGIETLDEVLTSLCLTRNASFEKLDNNNIRINGIGCTTTMN